MNKVITYIILLGFTIHQGFAQDIHFSQFDASPLTLNPALTGANSCDYRFAANYRNQWAHATSGSPFLTFDFSFDGKFMKDQLFGDDYLGGGFIIVSDNAGDGNLNTTKLMLSGAYNRYVDGQKRHQAAIGIQVGMVQKTLDYTNLRFPNQFIDLQYDPAADHGETNLDDQLSYMDLQVGGLWQFQINEKYSIAAGAAYFHVTQPEETFLGDVNKLDSRTVFHTNGRIFVNEDLDIVPSILYMNQAKAQELMIGSAVEYTIHPENLPADLTLGFGAWWRTGDAIILVPSAQFNNWRLGISYDVNVSSLRNASNYKGGFEFSLIYVFCQTYTPKTSKSIIPCRVF